MSLQPLLMGDPETAGATFDEARVYRYTLWRRWSPDGGTCVWVMLNPSTADETVLDPTIRRCMSFTRAWGHGGLVVVNLYALRSTNPVAIYQHAEPVGPLNDYSIGRACLGAARIVVAWGTHGSARGAAVAGFLRNAGFRLECLGVNSDGSPKHPLYIAGGTAPTTWRGSC